MKHESLFLGAAILLVCNFISRILGFVYKIVLVRLVGAEGIGITEMISPIYSFALVVASLSLPLAMSQLISSEIGRGRFGNISKIWQVTMGILCATGLATTAVFYFFAPYFMEKFAVDSRGLAYFHLLVPAIFIVTICSGFRCYFQCIKQISAIGISQNIEQLVRVALGAGLCWYLLPQGLETAILGIAVATVVGELCGLLHIFWQYRRKKLYSDQAPTMSTAGITTYLFQVATPVTFQRIIATFIFMVQALYIPWTLQNAGLTLSEATAAYGNFSAVAMSLVHLPGIFTATLAMAILPSIAESANNSHQLSNRINQSLHITSTISLPFMIVLYTYATLLCQFLFNSPEAAASLKILASCAIFIYGQTALTSILQGLGMVKTLLVTLIISALAFFAAIYVLVPIYKIEGAALAFLFFSTINCLLNLGILVIHKKIELDFRQIIGKPLLAALVFYAVEKASSQIVAQIFSFNDVAQMVISTTLAGVSYILILWLIKGLPSVFFKYINYRR